MSGAAIAAAPASDLLTGVEAIAVHLSMTRRQIYHLHETGELPTFKLGAKVCARRSELEGHFARASASAPRGPKRREAAPSAPRPATPAPQLLYGHRAIAEHLGLPTSDVTRMDAERLLPTYQDDGCTVASDAALDHWKAMKGNGQ